jgi:putative ABC transport system ATP-binding protein
MELLEEINRNGATIVMVTHDPELARRAPRNIQVVDGQLADFTLYQGKPETGVSSSNTTPNTTPKTAEV